MNASVSYFELAKEDWSEVDFGDKRLNDRAIQIGGAFLRSPFISPPKMLRNKKDIKAFYRFMDSEQVSHDKLVSPHVAKTRANLSQKSVVLTVQDSTTFTYKRNYEIEGLYDVGGIPGIVVHNTISVIPYEKYGIIDGLLNQIVHKRKPKEERSKDDNEIKLWTKSIAAVGIPPEGTVIIDVVDRGADALEVMHFSKSQHHEFIVRACNDRLIYDNQYDHLFKLAKSLPTAGYRYLELEAKEGRKKRRAKLDIAFSKITLSHSKNQSQLLPLECCIVHVYEKNPPKGQEPLEWFLLTSLDVKTFKDALRITQYYSYRWIIEEYHKCMKTGFRIEKTQLKSLPRIESLLGFIAVASIKLLQLRDVVRHNPDTNAQEYVEPEDVQIVQAYYKLANKPLKIGCFLKYIAQMGGFLNRKNDGNPGWQSLWEGWKFFLGLKEGARLYKEGLIYG